VKLIHCWAKTLLAMLPGPAQLLRRLAICLLFFGAAWLVLSCWFLSVSYAPFPKGTLYPKHDDHTLTFSRKQLQAFESQIQHRARHHIAAHREESMDASSLVLLTSLMLALITFSTRPKSDAWARWRLSLVLLGLGLQFSSVALEFSPSSSVKQAPMRFYAQTQEAWERMKPAQENFSREQFDQFAREIVDAGWEMQSSAIPHGVQFAALVIASGFLFGIASFPTRPLSPPLFS
jgi:hypothetical protein